MKKDIDTKIKIVIATLIILLFSFTFSNLLFPLAGFPKIGKIVVFLFFIVFFSLIFYYLFWKKTLLFQNNKSILRILGFSFLVSIVLFSLVPIRTPYYPIKEEIVLKTSSPELGFSYISRNFEKDESSILKPEFDFSGSWNTKQSGWLWQHKGEGEGEILYEGTTLIREPVQYEIGLVRSDVDAQIEIMINGESYSVLVPAADNDEHTFSFVSDSQEITSYSTLWRMILIIYPFANFLTLFLIIGFAFLYIDFVNQEKIKKWIQFLIFTILFYLFWLALPYQNRFYNMESRNWWIFLVGVIFFIGVPIGIGILVKKFPKLKWLVFVGVLFVAIAVRVYWMTMVHSVPVSDFGDFHRWAMQILQGGSGGRIYIDRYPNFTRLLALFYGVFPTINAVQYLNVFFSVGTAALIGGFFWLFGFYKEGVVASYLFAIFPSEFSMVTLVNTEMPSVFFLTLGVFFFAIFLKNKKLVYSIFSALAFCFATVLRGALIIYILVFIIGFLILYFQDMKIKIVLMNAGVFVLTFILATKMFGLGINQVTVEGLEVEEGYYIIWPLVNGVNVETLGRTNDPDNAMVHSWDADEATFKGLAVVFNRLFSNPVGFYKILGEKYEYMFADATYMTLWAFVDESLETFNIEIGWDRSVEEVQNIFAQLSQYAYVIVLFFGVIASFNYNKSNSILFLLPSMVVLSSLMAYTFFEVQPRYQRPIIPFLIIIASLCFRRQEKASC